MTARATIVSDRVRDALGVPVSAVFAEQGQWVCFVRRAEAFRVQPVTVGRQNLDFAEITSGLDPGDQVGLSRPGPASLVQAGPRKE